MKFSFAYVKSNPVLFGGIVLVFGLVFWMLLNRGAPAAGNTTMVSAGPSDAQLAMGAQVTMAQINAGAAVQAAQIQFAGLAQQGQIALDLAGMETAYRTLELASNERLGTATIDASVAALGMQFKNSVDITNSNNQFMVDYAQVSADSARDQLMIGAALQSSLSRDQLEAYKVGVDASKFSAVLGTIGTLKKKDRDNALAGFTGYMIPNDPQRSGGGGFSLSSLAGILSPALALTR